MSTFRIGAIAAGAAVASLAFSPAALAVKKQTKTVNGFKADVYTWVGGDGIQRSVALKKQGAGNAGNGGYAIQMMVGKKNEWNMIADAPKDDGFGYFVSHERFRKFADGDSQTIAAKIFNKDDSPLGRGFEVKTTYGADGKKFKSVTFALTYPRYGTKAARGDINDAGEDTPPLATAKNTFKLYDLPVKITWAFQDGRNYPRIRTMVDLSKLPGPDRVSFDLRGPYGKLDFDGGANPIEYVTWGDRYLFQNTATPLRRNASWIWNTLNPGARYNAIIAAGREFGLVEPRPYAQSPINDGYSSNRSVTSLSAGSGCGAQTLPCDYEWPYQSSQYELPYDNPAGATISEKIAWGSTPFYGMSIANTFDGVASSPFKGFPKSKKIVYDVCVVYGAHVVGGLARKVATVDGPPYDCAKAP